jgi:acyl-CoA synthetase (AMP-forming)/AMP-acid ligase II
MADAATNAELKASASLADLPAFAEAPWHSDGSVALRDAARPGLVLDYAGLRQRAGERASLLLEQGLRPGQAVAMPVQPGLDPLLMQHALARAGGILLPVSAGSAVSALRPLLETVAAEWIWEPDSRGLRLAPPC